MIIDLSFLFYACSVWSLVSMTVMLFIKFFTKLDMAGWTCCEPLDESSCGSLLLAVIWFKINVWWCHTLRYCSIVILRSSWLFPNPALLRLITIPTPILFPPGSLTLTTLSLVKSIPSLNDFLYLSRLIDKRT